MRFPERIHEVSRQNLERVRGVCSALGGTLEKLSHGEPTFFVNKRVYVMFSNNHHNDGYIAIWIPVPEGKQGEILAADSKKYFLPPYVGKQGWIGLDLTEVSDGELLYHVETAWELKRRPVEQRLPRRLT